MQSPEQQPLVSITIFCYNHERFIEECLEGVRAQTYQHTELIIMDDASTDRSVAVIREWIARHNIDCLFIAHEQNQGVSRTVNEAFARARGKYISPCSGDDVWLPDKLEKQVPIMQSLPEDYALVYSDAFRIDHDGNLLPKMFIEIHRKFDQVPNGDVRAALLEGNFIPGMTMLLRREAPEQVGSYDPTLGYEDWDMMLRLAQRYKFAYSPHVSVKYRVGPSSLTDLLIETNSPAYLLTNFTLLGRSLGYSWISPQQRARLLAMRRIIAETLYRTKAHQCRYALRETLRDQFDLRTFVIYLLSVFRIPASVPSSFVPTLRRAARLFRPRSQVNALPFTRGSNKENSL
jgi:glycosyltransferase involved in cell wall biosynthesis